MSIFFVLVWLLAAQCAWAVPDTAQYYNHSVLSSSSNYDWSPGGGCSYIQNIPSGFPASSIWSSTGIAIQNYHNGQVCGMCVKITNVTNASPDVPNTFPSPPFIAIITNTGNDVLSDYWLDFYQKPATGGNWWLNWQAVDCPVGEQGIQWQVQSDSGYYFKVVPIYARIVVHTMCVLATKVGEVNSTWVQMDRYDNGNFYFTAGSTYQPLGAPKVKAISADGQVVEDTIDINLANSGRYVDWAIHPGTNPSNFRPLSGAITSNPPDCNGKVTNDDHYNGGDLSSASLLHHPALLW